MGISVKRDSMNSSNRNSSSPMNEGVNRIILGDRGRGSGDRLSRAARVQTESVAISYWRKTKGDQIGH